MFHLKKNRIESVPSENEHVADDDGNDGGQELMTPKRADSSS